LNTQKEEVDGVPCDKAQVSNHQSTIYKGPLNNHTVSKHQPHRSSSKRSQKGSASDLLRTLDHQNIDTIWFLDEEVGPGYQVTFSSSVTLYTLTQGGCRLSVERAECYFKQAVRGVEYLHSTGIAHRDINPENLLVAVDGTITITDFSHAGRFWASGGEMSKIRLSSNRCGSPSYLAPEVFVERHFDPRPVDMWALAIVYMEMRTGRLLWTFAAEGGDEYYDKYLQDRSGLWGYRPVENLENVSHHGKRGAQHC
jgi:serine/threonine protein kinase